MSQYPPPPYPLPQSGAGSCRWTLLIRRVAPYAGLCRPVGACAQVLYSMPLVIQIIQYVKDQFLSGCAGACMPTYRCVPACLNASQLSGCAGACMPICRVRPRLLFDGDAPTWSRAVMPPAFTVLPLWLRLSLRGRGTSLAGGRGGVRRRGTVVLSVVPKRNILPPVGEPRR